MARRQMCLVCTLLRGFLSSIEYHPVPKALLLVSVIRASSHLLNSVPQRYIIIIFFWGGGLGADTVCPNIDRFNSSFSKFFACEPDRMRANRARNHFDNFVVVAQINVEL